MRFILELATLLLALGATVDASCLNKFGGRKHSARPLGAAVNPVDSGEGDPIIRNLRVVVTFELLRRGYAHVCDGLFSLIVGRDNEHENLSIAVGPALRPEAGADWTEASFVIDPDAESYDAPRQFGSLTPAEVDNGDYVLATYTPEELNEYIRQQGIANPNTHEFIVDVQYVVSRD
jgi:hypothetical protein